VTTSVADKCAEPPELYRAAEVLSLGGLEVLDLGGTVALALDETRTGTPTGVDDWYLIVELLASSQPTTVVGTAVVGSAVIGDRRWWDITEKARGLSWTQGADQFGGRPVAGVLNVTLDAGDALLAAWNTTRTSWFGLGPWLRPGVPVRVGVVSELSTEGVTPGWLPLFTGVVEAWPTSTLGLRADEFVELVVVDTIAVAAKGEPVALSAAAGDGERADARCERILDHVAWQFGFVNELQGAYTDVLFSTGENRALQLQGSTLSQPTLTELYLTADSTSAQVMSDRQGRIALVPRIGSTLYTRAYTGLDVLDFIAEGFRIDDDVIPYVADSVVYLNDDLALVNAATVGLVGDVDQAVTVTDDASIYRHNATYGAVRTDLIATESQESGFAELIGADVREVLAGELLRPSLTRRAEFVQLDSLCSLSDGSPGAAPTMFAAWCATYGSDVVLVEQRPGLSDGGDYRVDVSAQIRSVRHDVLPLVGAVHWRAGLTLDTRSLEVVLT
jgi:hypothetical protein